ncbi:unnamed protein product [Nesidiocoris tenuis]|uniref:Uncharacterized protein n=1 Tax=Nesidiocoris tenuis TaxID=355587 RepID=A0A6H5G0P9_9HEMI|nr:unnamed protein product [Nesidiocoris tenuis]
MEVLESARNRESERSLRKNVYIYSFTQNHFTNKCLCVPARQSVGGTAAEESDAPRPGRRASLSLCVVVRSVRVCDLTGARPVERRRGGVMYRDVHPPPPEPQQCHNYFQPQWPNHVYPHKWITHNTSISKPPTANPRNDRNCSQRGNVRSRADPGPLNFCGTGPQGPDPSVRPQSLRLPFTSTASAETGRDRGKGNNQ